MSTTWADVQARACPYCGLIPAHGVAACPNIAEIEYYENGTIKRIVKRGPLDYWRQLKPASAPTGEAE